MFNDFLADPIAGNGRDLVGFYGWLAWRLFGTGDASVGTDTLLSIESIRGTQFNDTYVATGFGSGSINAGSGGGFNSFEGMGGNVALTLGDYKVPCAMDTPPFRTVLLRDATRTLQVTLAMTFELQ